MPDWKSFVRERLIIPSVDPQRASELIEDISQQLEDVYQEVHRHGGTEREAMEAAMQHIPDWNVFAVELSKTQSQHRPALEARVERNYEKTVAKEWSLQLYGLFRDLLYGARMLRRNPRFAILASVTIALGIAATTAIFSVVNAVILKPLPYDHPERIFWIWGSFSQGNRAAVSPPDFLDYRAQSKSFEHLAAMHIMHQFVPRPVTVEIGGNSVKFDSAQVSSGFFEVFGARPLLGRTFQFADEQQDGGIAILSYSAWQRYFAGDSAIAGKTLLINQSPVVIAGVMEQGFGYPMDVDLWMPLLFTGPEMKARAYHFLRPIGRVLDGIALNQAQAELRTIAGQLEKQYPETNHSWTVRLETLQQQMVGDLKRPMMIIFAAVSCLLLIACVNVANLLLSRLTARQKEIAVRVALGAGRKRLLRQLLAENLLLTLPAGLVGLVVAYLTLQIFIKAGPDFLPRLQEVQVDISTLVFTMICSLVTAILVSIAPALNLRPQVSAEKLKEGKYSGARTAGGRLRQVLAVSEIAMSLVLLAGAGLLLKSFWNLTHVDLGFDPNRLLTVRITLDEKRYPDALSVVAFVEKAVERAQNLPGVESAAAGTGLPLVPAGGDRFFEIEGRPVPKNDADKPNAQFRSVTRDYFTTLSIPLVQGRSFSQEDHETSQRVVMVNEQFARNFFPDQSALGKFIDIDVGAPFRANIIGIVKGARQNLVEEPTPEMYVLHQQNPIGYLLLTLRMESEGIVKPETVQGALREIDRDLAFQRFRTMEEIKDQAAIRNRLNASLLAGAAAIALILAAVGIYGVLSFSVEQRQQEIGVRLALGARRQDILALILRHGLRLAIVGLLFGICGALLLTGMMRTLLYEVSPNDPLILLCVSLILGSVAMIACWLPASRATRIDPLRTLRYE